MIRPRTLARPLIALLSCSVASLVAAALSVPFASASPSTTTPASVPAAHQDHRLGWSLLDTGSTSHFRGLAPVSRSVTWVSGYDGVVLRTVDGGRSWRSVGPSGAETLQLRDISAFDARHAVAMAAGSGTDSRLYRTVDGGRSWQLAYQNTDPAAFFDCMSFYDSRHGLVVSDPVDGKFRILSTADGGAHWRVLPSAGMPVALPGEAGFAASGECLTTEGHDAWLGSGGGASARVFHSADGGLNWKVRDTLILSSPSAGVFGLAFRHGLGIAVGGDFAAPAASSQVAAVSLFGSPWLTPRAEPAGYRSGVTWAPSGPFTALAVGLTGSDVSFDAGVHWHQFDTGQFDSVSCARDGACWASGDLGRVALLRR